MSRSGVTRHGLAGRFVAIAVSVLLLLGGIPADAVAVTDDVSASDFTSTDQIIVGWADAAAAESASEAGARTARVARVTAAAGEQATWLRTLAVGGDVYRFGIRLSPERIAATVGALRAQPGVAYVEPDWIEHAVASPPNDPYWTTPAPGQWDLSEGTTPTTYGIDLLGAWDTTLGTGVVVAVIDTGITAHPEFAGQTVAGYDFIGDLTTANDGDGRDADPSDPGDWCGTGTSSWHGTHVSGTIGALANNAIGIAGIAPSAKIQPVRYLGKCGGYSSDRVDAMVWASGGTVSGVPANATPARVINISAGGAGPCDSVSQAAVDSAVSRGTVVVVAAGNNNADASGYRPASCNGVITVAATDRNGVRASFSNYGSVVEIAAPGVLLWSTLNDGTTVPGSPTYARYSGTSMANAARCRRRGPHARREPRAHAGAGQHADAANGPPVRCWRLPAGLRIWDRRRCRGRRRRDLRRHVRLADPGPAPRHAGGQRPQRHLQLDGGPHLRGDRPRRGPRQRGRRHRQPDRHRADQPGLRGPHPDPTNNPTTSTLNFPLGDNRANGVTVALSATGTLSATYVGEGGPSSTTHLVFDVTGYFVPDASGATYVSLTPARLLDTRVGNGLSGTFSSTVARTFAVTGHGGVPANAVAVTGNLTVTGQTSPGFVALTPDPTNNPTTSTLNFPLGDNRANGVTVALSATGTLSATYVGEGGPSSTTHLVFDVTGYFVPDASGATYVSLTPARLLDTRVGNGLSGTFSSTVARTFAVTGRGGVPANAVAVTGNLTVTGQTSPGFVALTPDPTNNPTTSTLNFPLGDNRANGVTVALSATGTLSATYVGEGGPSSTTHLVFDVTGYFVP